LELKAEFLRRKPKAFTVLLEAKKAAKEIGTCSLNKKEIGDRVKNSLALEK
jgi:hypothetical protein